MEKKLTGGNRKYGWFFVTLLVVGIMFYLLNIITPLFADDFSYSYSWFDGTRIETLRDVFLSQYAHYFEWGGRVVVHFLAQTFLLLGKNVFNVLNVFGFLAFGLVICYHGTGSSPAKRLPMLIAAYCLLFLLTPAFGESYLWLTGAGNYLWGPLILLAYLIPYRWVAARPEQTPGKGQVLKFIGMQLAGFIAGATNENTGVALIVIIAAYLAAYRVNGVKIRPWMVSIGSVAGCLFMLLAPGNAARAEVAMIRGGGSRIKASASMLVQVASKIGEHFYLLLLLAGLLAAFYFVKTSGPRFTWRGVLPLAKKQSVSLIFILGFLAAAFSMIVPASFPDRAWSGPLAFLLIAVISLYDGVRKELKLSAFLERTVAVLLAFAALCSYPWALNELDNAYEAFQIREALIEESKAEGVLAVRVPAITSSSKYSCFEHGGDLVEDTDDWPNTALARYYGVEKIIRDDSIVLLE